MISTKTEQRAAKGRKALLSLGFLLAALVVACVLLMAAKPVHAQFFVVFTVNSTADEPDASAGDNSCDVDTSTPGDQCTLRAAIQDANANGTTVPDFIDFNISGSGVKTISPSTSLPVITEPVVIDGYTQPGCSPNTLAVGSNAIVLVRLDGINIIGAPRGISISAANSVVRGLSITRFGGEGISLFGLGNNDNTIEGNFVGITPGGLDRGNAKGLVIFSGSSNNTVGGTIRRARNIISGNNDTGVDIFSNNQPTTGNKVMGNYIGTTKSGTGDLGNTGRGVTVYDGASGTTVGDNDPSDGLTNAANIIAFNGLEGVNIDGSGSIGNRILSNSIFSNARLGIDLGGNGVTPNDGPGDADTGPNNLQNFPAISSAQTSGGSTIIRGSLKSTPNETFTLQFFSSPLADPSGFGEGKKFIGQRRVTTDTAGNASFSFRPTQAVPVGQAVTATATDTLGNTSEFSKARGVVRS